MLAELAPELSLERLEVDRLHVRARTAIDAGLVTDDLAPEGLREATDGLAEVALEELDDGSGEVETFGVGEHVLLRERVGSHPLGKVTNNLRRGRDLDDVAALYLFHVNDWTGKGCGAATHEIVGLDVLPLDLRPLGAQTELRGLELHDHDEQKRNLASLTWLTIKLVY